MTLTEQARRALILANGAKARKKKSSDKYDSAVKLVARVLMRENQRSRGCKYEREQIEALRVTA